MYYENPFDTSVASVQTLKEGSERVNENFRELSPIANFPLDFDLSEWEQQVQITLNEANAAIDQFDNFDSRLSTVETNIGDLTVSVESDVRNSIRFTKSIMEIGDDGQTLHCDFINQIIAYGDWTEGLGVTDLA